MKTLEILPILALGTAFAQAPEAPKTPEPQKFYKLDFVVKEVEGTKVLNARSYSVTLALETRERERASIRAGTKVPVTTSSGFNYVDVGVNIDCNSLHEQQRDLSLYVSADISSLPEPSMPPAGAPPPAPIVRQNRWSSVVIVPVKRPTLIFSSDDPASKRQMQMELTATPIN